MTKIESTLKSFLENYLLKIDNNAAIPEYKDNIFIPEISTNYGFKHISIEYFPLMGYYTIKNHDNGVETFTANVDKFEENNDGESLLKQIYKDLMVTETKTESLPYDEEAAAWFDNLTTEQKYELRIDDSLKNSYTNSTDEERKEIERLFLESKEPVYTEKDITEENPEFIPEAAHGKKVDERFWVDFYENDGQSGEIKGSYTNIEDAFKRANEFLTEQKLNGSLDALEFDYIGVNGTGKDFAISYISKNHYNYIEPKYFKKFSQYTEWRNVAREVLANGKPQIGHYTEIAAKGKKIEIKYPTERLSVNEQSIEERELEVSMIDNNDMISRQENYIHKNLMNKLAKGNFDINLAPKAFSYLVDNAIKEYNRIHGGGMKLSKEEKLNLAKERTNMFLNEASLGNYENESYLQKQYLMRGGYLVGASHAEDGIKIITPEGTIEAEGGEVIINAAAVKENCELLSKINQSAGDGVSFECGKAAKGKKVKNPIDIHYKGHTINVLKPSGMYEYYSNKEKRFIKSDDFEYIQSLIDNEKASKGKKVPNKRAKKGDYVNKNAKAFTGKNKFREPKDRKFEIKNQYEGKTNSEIWNNWTASQRYHFLHDHDKAISALYKADNNNTVIIPTHYNTNLYNELPEAIKTELKYHIDSGQYGRGGKIEELSYDNAVALFEDGPYYFISAPYALSTHNDADGDTMVWLKRQEAILGKQLLNASLRIDAKEMTILTPDKKYVVNNVSEKQYDKFYEMFSDAMNDDEDDEAKKGKKIKPKSRKEVSVKLTGPKQTKRGIHNDSKFKAKHAGKRTTKEGSVYYEYRKNRSDKDKRTKL